MVRAFFLIPAHEEKIKKKPKETSLIIQISNRPIL